MRILPTLTAFFAFCLFLLGWRLLYPTDAYDMAGMVCLGALALLSLSGGYRVALGRQRALISASVEPESGLRNILSGRLGAAFRAIAGTATAIPVAAYVALAATGPELLLAAAAAAWAVAMALLADGALARHLRPEYRMSLVASAAIWVAAVPVVAVAVWFSYSVLPIPDYALLPSLPEVLRAAVSGLPRQHPVIFEVLTALRSLDAATYWVLDRQGFQATLPLLLFLLKGAVAYVSITKVAVDCQTAFHGRATA